MPKSGLNKQKIVDAAIQLIEEKGYRDFSLHALAKRLNVKTASLYKHVENLEEILSEVGAYSIRALNEAEYQAISFAKGDEAVFALARGYYEFARRHPELYRVVMSLHRSKNPQIEGAAAPITEPFLQVLEGYPLSLQKRQHWQRVLRSILHGFASQEEAGYFCHFPIDGNESFAMAIQCFLDGLHAAIERGE